MKKKFLTLLKSTIYALCSNPTTNKIMHHVAHNIHSYRVSQVFENIRTNVFSDEVVLNGPFKGMKYPQLHFPKMMGCYEDEIYDALESLFQKPYTKILNLGSADGYYSLGFAYRFPQAQVLAYELNLNLLEFTKKLAKQNGFENIEYIGPANIEVLNEAGIDENTFVFCDVDSYEFIAMDPEKVPGLKKADLLIELHDFMEPGWKITDTILKRFESTHDIEMIREKQKIAANYPQLEGLSLFEKNVIMDEDRPSGFSDTDMSWVVLRAKG